MSVCLSISTVKNCTAIGVDGWYDGWHEMVDDKSGTTTEEMVGMTTVEMVGMTTVEMIGTRLVENNNSCHDSAVSHTSSLHHLVLLLSV
jgi:hypothetical protein